MRLINIFCIKCFFNFVFQAHAKWLLENNKFQHSSQSEYGENLCRITWDSSSKPSSEDKLAMASFAVEEWYKEWYNYSKRTHKWNGNIFHDEQIGHFLQVYESQNIKIFI